MRKFYPLHKKGFGSPEKSGRFVSVDLSKISAPCQKFMMENPEHYLKISLGGYVAVMAKGQYYKLTRGSFHIETVQATIDRLTETPDTLESGQLMLWELRAMTSTDKGHLISPHSEIMRITSTVYANGCEITKTFLRPDGQVQYEING